MLQADSTNPPADLAQLPKLSQVIAEGMAQGLHIGAQLYVNHEGETIADAAVGEASPGLPMTRDTLSLWLSSGKPITSVALAQFYEQGELDWHDPVIKFIPEFGETHDIKKQVTLHHLLTHTSGTRTARFKAPQDSWDTVIHAICEGPIEPRWTLGETAGYHPMTSWYLLGEIIQRLSGQTFNDYIRQHIFDLLIPDSTNPEDDDPAHHCWMGMTPDVHDFLRTRGHLMRMHNTTNGIKQIAGYDHAEWCCMPRPGGNAYGPVRHLGKLYEALLHGTTDHGIQLLQSDTVDLLTQRHRQGLHDKTFNATIDFGLGFIINSDHYAPNQTPYQYGPHASPNTFGHSGNTSSAAFADPDHDLIAAIVFNGMPGEAAHQQRIRQSLAALYEDLHLSH